MLPLEDFKPDEPKWTKSTCPTCGQECEAFTRTIRDATDEYVEEVEHRPTPETLLVAAEFIKASFEAIGEMSI